MQAYSHMEPTYMGGDPGGSLAHGELTLSPHQGDQGRIPLVCHSCEKHQKFSDLSHLLTHVSSKAHLLELYNLRIMSQTDPASARRCQKFDIWNKAYNIDRLVLQRMEARGEKGMQLQGRGRTPRGGASGRSTSRRGRGGTRGRRGNTTSRGRNRSLLDLPDVKDESDEGMGFPDGFSGLEGPAMQPWQDNFNTLISHESGLDIMPQADFEDLEGDENASSKYEPSEGGSSFPSENITETTDINELDAGPHSLKGIVYPGMGLFDAAGEEQRRKRNQRKPPAVLQQLQINSTLVTTREEVFDNNFDHQRTRDVYDDPSADESEDDEDEDVDRKRKRRSSQARVMSTTKTTRSNPLLLDARVTRATRAAAQAAAQRLISAEDAGARMTRSAANRTSMSQEQLPLHNHGFQGGIDMFHGSMSMNNELGWDSPRTFAGDTPANTEQQILATALQGDTEGSESWLMPQFPDYMSHGLTYHDSQDRLPGLALRPGNPNLSFASSTPGFKRSPTSHFSGKENDALKPAAASSNPYLRPTASIHGESFNPLYSHSQPPQDGLGFRIFPYDEGVKQATAGFQPINGHGGYSSLQAPSPHNSTFPSNQGNGDNFDL